ncbi:Sterile alpha motif (SAM) domain-containing protein [Melia azedarach]|uniref:Sterile alpha motif (SAM) domain-containing protein n=1 Tax=Melia azedarach TaxID=155640 RepID=A0ACC1XIC4_MELAZ|nr:Sterile alpha motif (SAM) domain-containing protein [Melia azedarach]
MAEASRARVTITLGRSGQVVKRTATVSDIDLSDSLPGTGSKRSVRDRLGSALDSSQVNNKRQRGDGYGYISSLSSNGVDDVRIGKNDLRLKLMQKNVLRRSQIDDDGKFVDLREKLSRTGQPPHSSLRTRQPMPESKETSILGRIPVTRSTDALPQMNSSRSSYSAWTLDHIRRRSPESIVGSSRGLSPPRNVEDLQRRPLSRTFDDVRAVPYMSKDVHNTPRPVSTSSYMAKPTLPTGSVKPLPPGAPLLGQLPPPTGIVQKSSYAGEEQQTVDGLLQSLGLGKYAILFKAEEVDMTALKQMGEHDLKELGIPMGPRKKILLALLPRSKRQQ